MAYQIKRASRPELDKLCDGFSKELAGFFGLDLKKMFRDGKKAKPNIFLLYDRKSIDDLFNNGKRTEDWLVGCSKNGDLYVLDKSIYAKESCHKYNERDYNEFIKHELVHCFTDFLTEGNNNPIWLIEGIAVCLSGQVHSKGRPKKLSNFLKYYDYGDMHTYNESGFAVEFLVKMYGKAKIIRLLKGLKTAKTRKDFAKLFEKVYGFRPEYGNFRVIS